MCDPPSYVLKMEEDEMEDGGVPLLLRHEADPENGDGVEDDNMHLVNHVHEGTVSATHVLQHRLTQLRY